MAAKETKLITVTGGSLGTAAKRCGERKEDNRYRYCIMVIVPERYGCDFMLSIPEGFHAVATAHGQYIGIWDSGLHIAYPWERVSHLVSKQYLVYDTPVKECPTLDNVMVEIDVNLVFSVMEGETNVKHFIYRLGPERLQDMLKAFQEEAVRGMARQKKYTNIYDLMDTGELPEFEEKKDERPAGELQAEEVAFDDDDEDDGGDKKEQKNDSDSDDDDNVLEQLANTKREMNQKLNGYGIEVYSITITNVRLPADFRDQMEEATTFESKNIEQESKQKYDLLVIENTEGRNKAMQALVETKEEAIVKKDQRAASENKTTDVFLAETRSIIAVIEEDMKAEIRDIKTNSELTVATLDAQKDEELAAIAAEALGEVEQINAELEGFCLQKRAESQKKIADLRAAEQMMLAKQENIMSNKLVSKRDFDSKMANLLVLNKMSNNRGCVVSGTTPESKDSTIAQLIGSKNSAISLNLR